MKFLTHIYAIRALIFGILLPGAFVAGFKFGMMYVTSSDVDFVSIYGKRMHERAEKLVQLQKWYDNQTTVHQCIAGGELADQRM